MLRDVFLPYWKRSAYLFFLSTYIQPRAVDDYPVLSAYKWHQVLGEDPITVTHKMLKDGFLLNSSLAHHMQLKFNALDLQKMLYEKNLPSRGTKAILIERLIQHDRDSMAKAVSDISIVECSNRGKEEVEKYFKKLSTLHPQEIEKKTPLPKSTIKSLVGWVLAAAVGGVIGNRADALFVDMLETLSEKLHSLQSSNFKTEPSISESEEDVDKQEIQQEYDWMKPIPTPPPTKTPTPQLTSTPIPPDANQQDQEGEIENSRDRKGDREKAGQGSQSTSNVELPDKSISDNDLLLPISVITASEIIKQASIDPLNLELDNELDDFFANHLGDKEKYSFGGDEDADNVTEEDDNDFETDYDFDYDGDLDNDGDFDID